MKQVYRTILIFVFVTLVTGSVFAAVPDLIPIQGVLADDMGDPVDETLNIVFNLYDGEESTSALWTDTFTVDVVDGFFTVYLGSGTTLDFASLLSNPELWLGVTVGSDSEMDRFQLTAVPFAVEAQVCQQIGSLTETDINNNFATSSHNHDGQYLAATYVPSWDDLTEMPSDFADDIDDGFTEEAELTTLLDDNYAMLSHSHDDVYFTETELQTSGSAAVHWDNLTSVPSDFADGIDDDTTYSGNDFALSGQSCEEGDVVTGIEADGTVTCGSAAGTSTRRWAALGRHATGNNIEAYGDYAVRMNYASSVAAWRVDVPHGATITRFAVTIAKCNDQTGNTATCRLRRHQASSFGSAQVLSEFVADGVLSPCSQTFSDVSVTNPEVSDIYVYSIDCVQTADKQTMIYGVQVEYTP